MAKVSVSGGEMSGKQMKTRSSLRIDFRSIGVLQHVGTFPCSPAAEGSEAMSFESETLAGIDWCQSQGPSHSVGHQFIGKLKLLRGLMRFD